MDDQGKNLSEESENIEEGKTLWGKDFREGAPWLFQEGNPGKPHGAKNKFTRRMKDRIEDVLEKLDEYLQDDIKELKANERVAIWKELQEFVRPKLQRIEMEIEGKGSQITQVEISVIRPGERVPGNEEKP